MPPTVACAWDSCYRWHRHISSSSLQSCNHHITASPMSEPVSIRLERFPQSINTNLHSSRPLWRDGICDWGESCSKRPAQLRWLEYWQEAIERRARGSKDYSRQRRHREHGENWIDGIWIGTDGDQPVVRSRKSTLILIVPANRESWP